MPLPWVRLDTQIGTNPKILELVDAKRHKAAFAYVCALAYAGAHGTDGFIPVTALVFIHATRQDANHLVDVGLWIPVKGGWAINGWDEFQISDEESRRRRERAQKGAAVRWDNARKAGLKSV